MSTRAPANPAPVEVIVIGASWGGLHALRRLLPALPADLPAPVCIVQHRAAHGLDETYLRLLQERCELPVGEAEDHSRLEPGRVLVAPADYHLYVEPGHVSLSIDERVRWSRPSVDVLFESAADSYGPGVLSVVLTGANDDGARGTVAVHEAGGHTIAQLESDAERPEMPRAAIRTGAVDEVLPLARIGARIADLCAHTRSEAAHG